MSDPFISKTVTDEDLSQLIRYYDAAPGAHWKGRQVVDCLMELQQHRAPEPPQPGAKAMSLAVALSFADVPRPRATMQAPADTEGELREALRVLATAVRAAQVHTVDQCSGHETNSPRASETEKEREFFSPVSQLIYGWKQGCTPAEWSDFDESVLQQWQAWRAQVAEASKRVETCSCPGGILGVHVQCPIHGQKAAAVPEPITCQLCYGQGGKHQYGCALNGGSEAMRTIWKFQITAGETSMPRGAEVCAFQYQDGVPCLWAIVDTTTSREVRRFRIFGTGQDIPAAIEWAYVDSVPDGPFVWHLFELL